jgi:predicted nucleic acid-binding Zn ribbon protein
VLAQWRGVDLAPLETAQAGRARRVGDVLPRVTKDLRMDQRRAEAEIVKVWNSLVDPNVTAHAQPVGLRKGTLFVNVDSSVWLAEIVRYRRKEILDRLQHSFGRNLIQRISFRVG